MYRLITNGDNKVKQKQNPRINASVFQVLTFGWMLNLFKTGRKKDLIESDLYAALKDHRSSSLGDKLEKGWKLELVSAHKQCRNPSLLRVLIRIYGPKYMLYGLILAVNEIILKMLQPLCISELLAYFKADSKVDVTYAYFSAFSLVFSTLISVFMYHATQLEILHCGMKMRVSCCSLIYRKALRLSHVAIGETTVGQVINLLSNDVNRFDVALTFLHFLWIGPLQTVIVTYMLWREIGVSSILGIATLLFFIPLQGWLGRRLSEFRSKSARKADERLRLMSEIISGIQVIKMYTWEKPFSKLIEYTRKMEIEHIKGSSYVRTILSSFSVIQIRFQLFLSILAYALLGNSLSIQKVFVITSLYNLLLLTMTIFFSRGLGQMAELQVSVKRIETYLLRKENDDRPRVLTSHLKTEKTASEGEQQTYDNDSKAANNGKANCAESVHIGAYVTNATAKWMTNDQAEVNNLENINLIARPNRLVAIIGPVGAGKSSLIQAILHELPLSKGEISVHGVVSYASQDPWLFSGSIRQNILFNSPMNVERYKQVIKACSLKNDFKHFPYGDRTMVGERGVTLSGGQRARINLARTVYRQADIYLLDDPLSAVDTRVGKHLFDKCIQGYLKDKTRILVTHQNQYLINVDQIVLIKNGNVSIEGSYKELLAYGVDFSKLLGSSDDESNVETRNNGGQGVERVLSSYGSNESISSLVDENKVNGVNPAQPPEENECRSFGRVKNSVYTSYMSAVGSACKVSFCLLAYIFVQVLITGSDYWISFWVNQEEYVFRNEYMMLSTADNGTWTTRDNFTDDRHALTVSSQFRQTYIIVYSLLIVSMIVAILVRSVVFVSVIMAVSTNLHRWMFNAIIGATMLFFNTNSSGRILNRFSKDIGIIDDFLPLVLLDFLQILALLMGIVFVVGLINIYLMIPTFLVGIIFYQFRVFYLPTTRSIKRLDGITRSPVIAHLKESLQGLTTIRAHKAEQILCEEFDNYQDLHSSVWYLFISSNEAFGLWLDIICLIYITIVVFSFLVIGNDIYGGDVGLVITQTIGLAGMVQWGIRQSAVLENQMTSVERVLEYSNCPQEPALQSPPDKKLPKGWPQFGKIDFQNVSLRYSPDTPQVLKNINFVIRPMEKIGIVGRTGAGKSSIIAALLRLNINEGNIFIDNVEIHGLKLHDLRSNISIIPQEPFLFSGTMRTNLDPFDEYPDHALWKALDEVQLKPVIENLPDGLNSKMSESGSNFSIGQRQLVCLARAVLRNNKILVLDEATANVDPQTDALIQNTIRNKFRTCTVLTIAHRLNTIMDSDRVLVVDAGQIVEFDHPYNLLKCYENGVLYKMVEETGETTANLLYSVAAESFMTMKMLRNCSIQTNDDVQEENQ